MKQITTKSGIKGYQCHLQENYGSFAEFGGYDDTYNLASRLGFKTAKEAWDANPIIQGSTNPEDFCAIPASPQAKEDTSPVSENDLSKMSTEELQWRVDNPEGAKWFDAFKSESAALVKWVELSAKLQEANKALSDSNKELREALQGIINSWDENMRGVKEEFKHSEFGNYWSPAGSMVQSETIAKGREALNNTNQ